MRWLVLLLLVPLSSACSLAWLPYGQLDMAEDSFATVTGDHATVVDLPSGRSEVIDLGFFAEAHLSPDGSKLVTAHQVGLGADCSGTPYRTLREPDGTTLEEWQTSGPLVVWDGGFRAGESRNWNGNPRSGPEWNFAYGDVLSADGSAWARFDQNQLTIHGDAQVSFAIDAYNERIGISDDGTVVMLAERERDEDDRKKVYLKVYARSMDGPNWNWTFPWKEGHTYEQQVTVGNGVAGVSGSVSYKLDLKTGKAWKLDTSLEGKSVDHFQGLGWMVSDENGENVHFVKDKKAWQKVGDTWLEAEHPGWKQVASAEGAPMDGVVHETPVPLPVFGLLVLLFLARKL